ncbi:MAG: helix-turn-helix domain-containing protein [Kiloniellales bacterium]
MKRPAIDNSWIGTRLKDPAIRKKKSDLAAALGVSNASITSLLKGERQLRLSELPAVSRLLRLTYDEILRRSTDDPGFRPDVEAGEAARIYRTTRDVLEALVRHQMSDMTAQEIDDYALLVSELATNRQQAEAGAQADRLAERLANRLESEVERLKVHRSIRRGES